MKTKSFITILLLTIVTFTHAQSTKTVELPYVAHSNTTALEISKVTLTESATILDIDAFFRPNFWIRVVSDSYLFVDGRKYMISDGDGIDLDSLFWMPASGEASFRLIFDPIPENSTSFDFLESDCGDCFKIWGVDLTNNKPTTPNIPNEYLQSHNTESTITSDWKKGKAKVSGQLIGYSPNIGMKARIVYFNPITSKEKQTPITISNDGTFSAEVDMINPSQVMLTYDSPQPDTFWFIAAPNEETKVIINLPEANRLRTRLNKESTSYGNKMYFSGYESKLNDELNNSDLLFDFTNQQFMYDILGMNMEEYKNYILGKYDEAIASNNTLNTSEVAKKIANTELSFKLNNYLMMSQSYLMQAFMQVKQLSWEEASKSVGPLNMPTTYNDYLMQLSTLSNNRDILLTKDIIGNMRMFGYVREQLGNFDFFKYLLSSDKVKEEDKKIISDFINTEDENDPKIFDGPIITVYSAYTDLQQEFMKNISGVKYLSRMWDIKDCFLFNLMQSHQLISGFADYSPLTSDQKEEIKKLPSIMQEVLLEENDVLLAKIEENKKKTGYTILETPDVADTDLFEEIIKQFKGKVIFVDVWATWCGPCIAANKEMDPIKAQLAYHDIVYLYLTDESSPLNTWENMITDLNGYHYRISSSSWNYLRTQLRSSGVPTYMIIDKEGNEVFHSVGFPGASTVVNELKKQLEM